LPSADRTKSASFSDLHLPEPILRAVRAVGYATPTPIQLRAIPVIMEGHDVVAAAQTGSGKTAAFVLPIIARLMHGLQALRALVLVPTRELAAQVDSAGQQYARYSGVRVGAVYGGVPIGPQEKMIRHEGVELLVATPGRLLDLHGRHSVSLEDVEVLVLDEADRMVDMGFAPDLRRILHLLPRDRQTLMFSATMPPELNAVAKEALSHPRRVDMGPPSKPAPSIAQALFPVPRHLKTDLLDAMLERSPDWTAIVFTRTKRGADRLTRQLKARGHDVAVLHGDRSQRERERALRDFKRGRVEVLVATDIASRGIDVDDVTHVVNFDVPRTPEDYVHRIGRTGRMDAEGDAITFVTPEDHKEVAAIERFIGRAVKRETLPGFDYHRRAPAHADTPHGGGHGRSGEGRSGRGGHGRDDRARHSGATHGRRQEAPAPPSEPSHGRRVKRGVTTRRDRKRM